MFEIIKGLYKIGKRVETNSMLWLVAPDRYGENPRAYKVFNGRGNYLENLGKLLRQYKGQIIVVDYPEIMHQTIDFVSSARSSGEDGLHFTALQETYPQMREMIELMKNYRKISFAGTGVEETPSNRLRKDIGSLFDPMEKIGLPVKLVSGCCAV